MHRVSLIDLFHSRAHSAFDIQWFSYIHGALGKYVTFPLNIIALRLITTNVAMLLDHHVADSAFQGIAMVGNSLCAVVLTLFRANSFYSVCMVFLSLNMVKQTVTSNLAMVVKHPTLP
jgi:hypothetical protein